MNHKTFDRVFLKSFRQEYIERLILICALIWISTKQTKPFSLKPQFRCKSRPKTLLLPIQALFYSKMNMQLVWPSGLTTTVQQLRPFLCTYTASTFHRNSNRLRRQMLLYPIQKTNDTRSAVCHKSKIKILVFLQVKSPNNH